MLVAIATSVFVFDQWKIASPVYVCCVISDLDCFRVLGLVGLVRTDCDDPTELHVHDGLEWPDYLGPISMLFLYCMAATDVRFWFFPVRKQLEVSLLI